MLDVLLALLLLATVLAGTCAALIQAVRASGESLRASRAADLAADLIEELRGAASATQANGILAAWRNRIPAALSVAGLGPEEMASLTASDPQPAGDATIPVAPLLLLRLQWIGTGSETRELVLPLAAQAEDTP